MDKAKMKDRYGKKPHIGPEPKNGDTDSSTHMAEASGEAKSTAGDDNSTRAAIPDPGPKADVMAGTDGIPVHARHTEEMGATHKRQLTELTDMQARHTSELKELHKRHGKDMEAGGTGEGEAADKAASTAGSPKEYPREDNGKTGTEPK